MMSVTLKSVKVAFACKSLEFAGLRENFLILFLINCHFGGHFSAFSFYFFFILLRGKCLQLDSNFIDYNLREKIGLRYFFHITLYFTFNLPPSWTPSWIYRNAQ